MPILSIYVSEETLERLQWYSGERDEMGRSVEGLAEDLIEDSALRADTRPRAKAAANV